MKKIFFYTAIAAAVLISGSCITTPICVTSSITPMEGKVVSENLGKTEGSDTAFSVFSLFMIGRPDLELAIKDALASKNADTLINVGCYERYIWFGLFSMTTVRVEGDAVKFAVVSAEPVDKKNEAKRDKNR